MPAPFIPLTRNRLKPYITLYAIRGGGFFQSSADFAAALAAGTIGNFVLIGAVEKLTETQERATNSVYRELNADSVKGTFGSPVESYPGLVSYSLSLTRVVLNDANLLEAFGFLGSNLLEQKVPLIVQLVRPVPLTVGPGGVPGAPITINGQQLQAETRTYFGCWFDKNTTEFEAATGDLKTIQETTMISTGVVSSKTIIPPA